jgi:hypothetical protein
MSFSTRNETNPIIGKVTPDKIQIYYDHTKLIFETEEEMESYQYYWHTIDVSIQSNMLASTVDFTWYDQIPTNEAIERVKAMHHTIMEGIIDQGYWCGEGYLLKINSTDKRILLLTEEELAIQPQHLIDNLFLLTLNFCVKRIFL